MQTAAETSKPMAFNAEVSKVLHLMIHSLYTNRDIFLRELISNASDACDRLRVESLTKPELLQDGTGLGIYISLDTEKRLLTVEDNGIGMSREELIANLGTIAKSGTQEFLMQITGDKAKDTALIGQFGVGFYSVFMVADHVRVTSTRAGTSNSHVWESDGAGGFTISTADATRPRGTSVILHLKEGEDAYLDKYRLRSIVQTYSDHIGFPILFMETGGKAETLNSAAALWMRPKADITPEQYKDFYRHVAHSPDEPWLTLHSRAEGKMEYTCLLFVPSMRPFDLFHPDRRRRVRLYVKRVFITEEGIDLIPHYLRFLRGVIDSEDLPLNISRETLQHNPLLAKIRESVVKRVISELKKKAENDEGGYAIFWKNFGAVFKEGLCEAIAPREQMLEVCRFHSTQGEKLTGLDAYIARMKEHQQHIFYLTAESLDAARASPQIEGFLKRGIEVLLLVEHVDDFWVNVNQAYKDKPFLSVTRAAIDLNAIAPLEKDNERRSDDSNTKEPDLTTLIAKLKIIYGDQVKDVRATDKLTDSPVCLAVEEGAMDIRFERFLVEQKQLPGLSSKILEINPSHPVIRAFIHKLEHDSVEEAMADTAWLLLDQARILEGEKIHNPAEFSRRMSLLLQRGLAA